MDFSCCTWDCTPHPSHPPQSLLHLGFHPSALDRCSSQRKVRAVERDILLRIAGSAQNVSNPQFAGTRPVRTRPRNQRRIVSVDWLGATSNRFDFRELSLLWVHTQELGCLCPYFSLGWRNFQEQKSEIYTSRKLLFSLPSFRFLDWYPIHHQYT